MPAYKRITVYFDMSKPQEKEVYDTICRTAKEYRKSSYIVELISRALLGSGDQTDVIAKKVADELKPYLQNRIVADTPEMIEENNDDLLDGMDNDFGDTTFDDDEEG